MSSIFKGLGKFGNVLEDAASFAIPAAIPIAAAGLTGGSSLAFSIPTLLSALGAGGAGLARNEQEERLRAQQLAQNKNTAKANFLTSLNPRNPVQPQQAPLRSPELMENVGRGVELGAQALAAAEAAKNSQLQRRLLEALVGTAERAAQYQMGRDVFDAGGQVPVTVTGSYNAREPAGTVMSMDLMKTAPPPAVASGFAEQEAVRKTRELQDRYIAARTQALLRPSKRPSKQKPLVDIMEDAVGNLKTLGPDGTLDLFMVEAQVAGHDLTPDDYMEMLNILKKRKVELSAENQSQVSRRLAIEDGLQRIRESIHGLSEEQFSTWAANWQNFLGAFQNGKLQEPEIRNLLGQIGLQSEMALRLFSGAAITQDEYDRFSNNFIGGLVGGRQALLDRLNNLELDFRNQRNRLIQIATSPMNIRAGIQAASDEMIVNMAIANDPAAIAEMERRPSAQAILKQRLGR